MNKENITKNVFDYHEKDIVDFLLQPIFRDILLEILGLGEVESKIKIFPCVKKPFIVDNKVEPGDIDILLFDPDRPEKAIAIEAKKIKVRTIYNKQDKIFKGYKNLIEKGLRQTAGLSRIGFYKTYFIVIIANQVYESDTFFASISAATMNKIRNEVMNLSEKSDDNKSGIIYIEITQPGNKPISFAGGIGSDIYRKAVESIQSDEITTKIKKLSINEI